jgi:CubicO group peptidase (beta-lactamase class C family)
MSFSQNIRNFMRWLFLSVFLMPSLAGADEPSNQGNGKITDKQLAGFSRIAEKPIDGGRVTALSIGVVHDERTWTGHFGRLSGNNRQPPNDKTIYEIGSISKVFTGILLAHAVKSGQLKLDQTIGSIIPEAQKRNPKVADTIELVHLSTHYSGLPRMPTNWSPAKRNEPYVDYDRNLLIEFVSRVHPSRMPNEKKMYSNVGVGLLGVLLAIEAQADYEALLTKKITRPLGMNDTTVSLDVARRKRLATPHRSLPFGFGLIEDTPWEFKALAGAGGIRSTTTDMIRLMRAALNPPEGLLGKAIDLSWEEHAAAKDGSNAMGLGWSFSRDSQARWHNGQTGGYASMVLVNRNTQTGVVVLSNTSSGSASEVCGAIYELLQE